MHSHSCDVTTTLLAVTFVKNWLKIHVKAVLLLGADIRQQ